MVSTKIKITFVILLLSSQAYSQKIPDAYEAVPGKAHALNGTSAAYGIGDLGALSTNPALLFTTPSYEFSASYHWPTSGREFYQTGIIDTKTRKLASAISYLNSFEKIANTPEALVSDSKIKQRIQTGFAKRLGKLSIGVGLQYLEGSKIEENFAKVDTKGLSFGLGVYTKFSQSLAFGASVANIGSKKVKDLAPKTYRAGISYTITPKWIANIDLRQRDRTPEELSLTKPERMGFASLIYKYQDKMELLASYGREFSTEEDQEPRESLSGGATIKMDAIKLGYTITKPYKRLAEKHQSIHVSFAVKM